MMIEGDTVVIAHHIKVMLHIGKNTPADLDRTQVFRSWFPRNAVASQAGTQDAHIEDSVMGKGSYQNSNNRYKQHHSDNKEAVNHFSLQNMRNFLFPLQMQ